MGKTKPQKNEKDEVLAARAQKGDRQAEETLIARYKQAVRYRAGTYFILGADRDDVVQEGMIGLFKAVRSYDAEKGASFSTYAGVCIERQILDAVKAASRKKHEPLNSSLSVEDEEGALWLSRLSGEEDSASWGAEDLLGQVYGDWKGEFSQMELEVLRRRLEGEDAKTIAAALGKEPKAVYNAVERLKKKIRSLAEERGLFH